MLKAIKLLLLFFLVIFLLVFFSLFLGIKIDSFSFANISISKFYLKLDKKLILNIEKFVIKSTQSKESTSFDEIKSDIQLFPKILDYFEEINIDELKVADNTFTIKLQEEYLYLDNKFLNLATTFEHTSSNTKFDLYSLHIKEYDLFLDGKIKIDYLNNLLNYDGKYFFNDIIGNLRVIANKQKVDVFADSNPFKNLHFLKPYLTMVGKEAKEWMYDNVKGDIKLNNFTATYDLVKNELIEDSLNGHATINKALIQFHKDVQAVNTTKVDVFFKDGDLIFDLENPIFQGVSINGSFVKIENLVSNDNGKVIVNIKANHKLDSKIQSILKAYKINIPLIQKDGLTNADLTLEIPYLLSKPMKTYGNFMINDANITISENFDFYSKSAEVILDGSIVKIRNADFKHKDMIDANVNLDIDTKTLKAKGEGAISSIFIKSKDDEILNVKNTKSKLELDFNGDVNIDLLDLKTFIAIDKFINIDLKDLSKLVLYSEILKQNNIQSGNLFIKVKDFDNLSFKGEVYGKDLQIYANDESLKKEIKKLYLDGEIKDSLTTLNFSDVIFKNENQEYFLSKGLVNLRNKNLHFQADVYNLDIPLNKNNQKVENLTILGSLENGNIRIENLDKTIIYESFENAQYDKVYLDGYDILIDTKQKNEKVKKYKLKAVNTNLLINDKYKFLGKDLKATLDENIVLDLKYNKSEIKFEDINSKNRIIAKNITDNYLNTIFKKDIFLGGTLQLDISGENYELRGDLNINNSRIKDLAFINNLITFVNTSPALINPLFAVPSIIDMVKNEGFNINGYRINEGNAQFKYSPLNDKILVTKLTTTGNSVDFDGSGIIDTKNDTLDMQMHLIFLKGYSNVVKNIPVVNYLFLGEKKRVESNVRIVGSLEDPEVKTEFLKEGINAPLDFGKRLLNTPKNIFDSIMGNE